MQIAQDCKQTTLSISPILFTNMRERSFNQNMKHTARKDLNFSRKKNGKHMMQILLSFSIFLQLRSIKQHIKFAKFCQLRSKSISIQTYLSIRILILDPCSSKLCKESSFLPNFQIDSPELKKKF